MKEYLKETRSINYSHPLVQEKIKELQKQSNSSLEYAQKAYEFVRDQISHTWDMRSNIVSKNASDVLKNQTGICWTKSCLLAALLRGNGIPSGISYQRLTRLDDASDGYILHALNTIYIQNQWIRVDARGNKENVHAQFCINQEILAFPIRKEYNEIDYRNNSTDLDSRLVEILEKSANILDVRADFDY
ncbi:MAG: transglutaminase-like domain-containing protein [Bacillota bacterium]|nr:transglutaminase-like domain-containing protein [Bacillota bacterium]